jgi:hypothetical protein
MDHNLFIKMALDAWNQYLKRIDDLFLELSDEQLDKQVAPGKNTARYLLGHMTAVHDRMMPLLGVGQSLYPKLFHDFEEKGDGDQVKAYSTAELRRCWSEVNTALNNGIAALSSDEWFARHNSVSDQDFSKEPHRNKLNVMLNRTNHIAWHYGQLLLLRTGKV